MSADLAARPTPRLGADDLIFAALRRHGPATAGGHAVLPADLAPGWGFSPESPPAPPVQAPKRRRRARRSQATGKPHPCARNVARWRAILTLASITGELRSAEVAGSLGIESHRAAAYLARVAGAGYLTRRRLEMIRRPQGGGKTWIYGITAAGRRWLAAAS